MRASIPQSLHRAALGSPELFTPLFTPRVDRTLAVNSEASLRHFELVWQGASERTTFGRDRVLGTSRHHVQEWVKPVLYSFEPRDAHSMERTVANAICIDEADFTQDRQMP